MSDDAFGVTGADEFLRLSKALKAAGALDLRRELHREIAKAARPLIPEVREVARKTLPQRGGLALLIGKKTPIRAQVRTGLDTAGVRLVAGKRRSAAQTANDDGLVRHPVFGNRKVWAPTRTRKGWFHATLNARGPEAAREGARAAMESIAQKVLTQAKG